MDEIDFCSYGPSVIHTFHVDGPGTVHRIETYIELDYKNKFEKLVHLVDFVIRIYHDARSPKRQIHRKVYRFGGLPFTVNTLKYIEIYTVVS